jgi:CheY-like chemotaxis protein
MGDSSETGNTVSAETRRVVHDLRQPLAAMQMWLDLLGEAQSGHASEKEERYLGKIRAEVQRMTALLARASSGASPAAAETTPEAASATTAPAASTSPAGPLAGLAVLVVEDDELSAEALQLALEGDGASVTVATSFAEGIDHLQQQRHHVVLSDLRGADGDGFAVVSEVRRLDQRSGRRTIAIAITGLDSPETRTATRDAGFDATLTKPFSITALTDSISRLAATRG